MVLCRAVRPSSAHLCRLKIYEALRHHGADVDVACSEKQFGGSDQFGEFEVMLSAMEQSRFCLVVTGDAMSTRRLSEIFMAGGAPMCNPSTVGSHTRQLVI